MSLPPFGGPASSSGGSYEAAEDLEPSLICEGSDLPHGLNLEALCSTYLKSPVREQGSDDTCSPDFLLLKSYQQVPVEDWNGEDCYDWATDVCALSRIDPSEVDLGAFRNMTGSTLAQLKKQHFSALCGEQGGSIFHKNLRLLVKRTAGKKDPNFSGFLEPQNADPLQGASSSSYPSALSPSIPSSDMWSLSTEEYDDLDRYIPQGHSSEKLPEDLFSLGLTDDAVGEDDEVDDGAYEEEDGRLGAVSREGEAEEGEGSSSTLHYEGACQAVSQKIKTNSRRGDRNPKIWEFLIRLLVDPRTNPRLVRWQDVSSATFVLVQPALIAQLWGARSKKPNLSANNFARALRYHYNTGALTAVSERHYMYRCGKKALQFLAVLKGGLIEPEGGK